MTPERIPFGRWTPDRPEYMGAEVLEAKNCIPRQDGYASLGSFQASTDAVGSSETILAAVWSDTTGVVEVIAGTATRLLRLTGQTWSVVGSGYSALNWEFAVFGTNIYAFASGVDVQVIDLAAGSPSFGAAPGSPPRAARTAVIRDFVFAGDLDTNARAIQWSGFNNAGIWDALGNVPTQADAQQLNEGGRVQKLVGGTVGYVFQELQIKLLQYIGPPPIFSIQPVTRNRGTSAPDSVVPVGDRIFFYAQDGFHVVQGTNTQPIGHEQVDQWFLDNADLSDIRNMQGVADRANKLIFWAFRSSATLAAYDLLLIFNYQTGAWSYAEIGSQNVDGLFELRNAGYDLDTLATILPGGVLTDSISVDSTAYLGGRLSLFASSTAGALGGLDGAALEATIDTAEFDAPIGFRRRIDTLRPIVSGGLATVTTAQLGRRQNLQSAIDWTSRRSENVIKEINIVSDSRYNRARVNIAGGFNRAIGVDVISRASGRR